MPPLWHEGEDMWEFEILHEEEEIVKWKNFEQLRLEKLGKQVQ